jgi:hypothetical protein
MLLLSLANPAEKLVAHARHILRVMDADKISLVAPANRPEPLVSKCS